MGVRKALLLFLAGVAKQGTRKDPPKVGLRSPLGGANLDFTLWHGFSAAHLLAAASQQPPRGRRGVRGCTREARQRPGGRCAAPAAQSARARRAAGALQRAAQRLQRRQLRGRRRARRAGGRQHLRDASRQ